MRITDQIEELQRDLANMPIHTPSFAKIPATMCFLPKNVMDYSAKVDNKFLNNSLSLVEEIQARQPDNKFVSWFRKYQSHYYRAHGILEHDGFFSRFHEWQKYNGGDPMIRGASFGNTRGYFNSYGKVNGATLETDQVTGSAADDTAMNHVLCNRLETLGTVGQYYDQIATRIGSTNSSNINMGVYDDTGSSVPNALLASTGGIAMPATTSYTFQSVTEFALTTTRVWAALNHSSNSGSVRRQNSAGSGKMYFKQPVTYPTLDNPISSPTSNDSPFHQKIGHS
jgi:hypothetical protein